MEIISSLWTFPAIILAALLIAWAAECGQFFISQGLALAVLAWVQTLPEFAVEGVITLTAAKDPSKLHLITANYTGSLRLFVGLGWPMVYFVSLFFRRIREGGKASYSLELDDEHCVAVVSLLPALFYFLIIYFKGTLNILDGVVLGAIYAAYLYLLSKIPPHDAEEIEDLGRIPKSVMGQRYPLNLIWVASLFILGALLLFFSARPFLNSMLAVAAFCGVSQFVFVQWVAPFLSEFPEKLSAFYWARKTNKAAMALINFVSSSINQWTILVALIPFIYSFGMGRVAAVVFDERQKVEILLTIIQSYLGFLFLVSMDFKFLEAAALFLLWLAQFLFPGIRQEITWVYGAWALIESLRLIKNFQKRNAFRIFGRLSREHLKIFRFNG
jgi:cation:H+ antiporter